MEDSNRSSDHLQITVQTVCLQDGIGETNHIQLTLCRLLKTSSSMSCALHVKLDSWDASTRLNALTVSRFGSNQQLYQCNVKEVALPLLWQHCVIGFEALWQRFTKVSWRRNGGFLWFWLVWFPESTLYCVLSHNPLQLAPQWPR